MDSQLILQDKFLEQFFKSEFASRFYLTGGTALARFYFHHRESLDLDLFTNDQAQDFDTVNRTILFIAHSLQLGIINQVTTATFLQYIFSGEQNQSLKVDIVKDIPVHFGEKSSEGPVRIDSLENIGSNKVLAIFGRSEAKDFIDLYWILQQTSFTFDHLFELAKEKDLGLNELYFSYALKNVSGITRYPVMLQPLPWEEIVSFFLELSRSLLLRIKPD